MERHGRGIENLDAMDSEPRTKYNDHSPTHMNSFGIDMVHSDEEVIHGLQHLIGYREDDGSPAALRGHETMVVYRNVRKKYSSSPEEIRDLVHVGTPCTFRTADQGLKAAYRASLCRKNGLEREASVLYAVINPRCAVEGMAKTQADYSKWMKNKAGLTQEQVKGGDREDYLGTMDKILARNILKSQSRKRLDMIDVDDRTWLPRIRNAIGDENIEMIVETMNGYHVVYRGKQMSSQEHRQLQTILAESPKGTLEKASRAKGSTVACALPGGYQSYHKSKIVYCACQRRGATAMNS